MTVAFGSAGAMAASASATSLTITLPTFSQGDGLIVMIAKNTTSGTFPVMAGWLKLHDNIPTGFEGACYFTIGVTGMANPAISWTGAAACAGQAYNFTGMGGGLGAVGITSSNTVNPHNCPNITSTWDNSLALAMDWQLSATAQATTPTGWTSLWANASATAGISFAGWSKAIAANGTSSGGISVTEGAVAWVQAQDELRSAFLVSPPTTLIWAG